MKSTRVFKILSIALAAAVVFYFLVQGVRYLTNPYATTRVYTSTTEESVEASGWLVRETLSARISPAGACAALAAAVRARGGEMGSTGEPEGAVIWATGAAVRKLR